jgi:streptogramin lyase
VVTQVDPRTGKQRTIRLAEPATPLAWSAGYGDLWMCNFDLGTLTRIHPAPRAVETVDNVGRNPSSVVVSGDVVWVGDWSAPRLVRLRAVGSGMPRAVSLPTGNVTAGVWSVAAGEGYVWATTPRDGALWRIHPKTNDLTRITVPHLPTGVTADPDGVWVTVRGE